MYYSPSDGSFSVCKRAPVLAVDNLSYNYGYEDWDYYGNGSYYTYIYAGEADID